MTTSLRLYLGPMFSSKSSNLLADLTKDVDIGLKALYIQSSKDKRDECKDTDSSVSRKGISCHSSQFHKPSPKIKIIRAEKLNEVDIEGYDTVGVDEAHFFDDLYEIVAKWAGTAREKDFSIICAGIDGSSDQKPIGQILQLIPLADSECVIKCAAWCTTCLAETGKKVKASFSKRLVADSSEICVGGRDKYAATCRKHHSASHKVLGHTAGHKALSHKVLDNSTSNGMGKICYISPSDSDINMGDGKEESE